LFQANFYGIAAAGKPIVMIGDAQGEIASLVRQRHSGITIAPGDAAAWTDTLQRWQRNRKPWLKWVHAPGKCSSRNSRGTAHSIGGVDWWTTSITSITANTMISYRRFSHRPAHRRRVDQQTN
jgi:hypothetical protein